MKLRFTPRALENISAIADYIRFRNPAAGAVRSAIYESLQDLILFPQVGRLQQTQDVRKFVTPRYAYLIYYTVDDAAGEIIILSVKHSAQKRDHEDA
jgi:plasmid stabilization system protein ParE